MFLKRFYGVLFCFYGVFKVFSGCFGGHTVVEQRVLRDARLLHRLQLGLRQRRAAVVLVVRRDQIPQPEQARRAGV